MSNDKLFNAWINPLQFLEVDDPWASSIDNPATLEAVVKFLCTPGVDSNLDSLVARYREISNEQRRLFAAPAEERILEKLVWPLRHAKASYIVGNYLGTISLCGMVSEMVAILLFEISEFRINDEFMDDAGQTALFGSSFEKLSQERRVKVLRAFNIIDVQVEAAFTSIRTKRRKYLHLWSQDHEILPKDAVAVYNDAVFLVVQAIGQDVREGRIYLNPALVRYLQRKGVYDSEENMADEQQSAESNSET